MPDANTLNFQNLKQSLRQAKGRKYSKRSLEQEKFIAPATLEESKYYEALEREVSEEKAKQQEQFFGNLTKAKKNIICEEIAESN